MKSLNLPQSFLFMMQEQLKDEYPFFIESLQSAPIISIRKNNEKSQSLGLNTIEFKDEEPVNWCPFGYYLSIRPQFTFDPLFHSGCYYVQESSSMFVHWFVKSHIPSNPIKALDICAAPGGKSTLLLSSLPSGSILFSNEIVHQRCQRLKENLIKWGNPNIIVTNNSSEDYLNSGIQFDLILCDAPCSGEGMFRKDPFSISEWSTQNVYMCSRRQREILRNIWPCLSPGGVLLYSTCTYNKEEDEDNARFIRDELGGTPLSVEIPTNYGIDTCNYSNDSIPVYHFFPHKCKGEGFFICAFRKEDRHKSDSHHANKNKRKAPSQKHKMEDKKIKGLLCDWMKNFSNYLLEQSPSNDIYAFPLEHADSLKEAHLNLNVVHYGIQVASVKGKGFKPAHCLSMSNQLNYDYFQKVDVDHSTAISYLQNESLYLPSSPHGFLLICYKGYPLGFVNNIGSRANNMYPAEWRIRKTDKFELNELHT